MPYISLEKIQNPSKNLTTWILLQNSYAKICVDSMDKVYYCIHPRCLFFDSPFSNFCQKKGTVSKKRHRVKKKAFLKQNFRFLSKKRHFRNKICDFCQKKGTLSKKRHGVKKKALKKDVLGHKFKLLCQSLENLLLLFVEFLKINVREMVKSVFEKAMHIFIIFF